MAEEKSRHWAAQAVQILRAVDLLARPQGASNAELQQELEIERRTVFRLKNALEELGFPLVELDTDGRQLRFGLQQDYCRKLPNLSVPDFRLSPAEVLALAMLRGSSPPLPGSHLSEIADRAFAKLDALLPSGIATRFAALGALFLPSREFGKDYSGKEEIINRLCHGIMTLHTCRVEYHAFDDNRVKRYRIDPLHLFAHDGGLYLLARITRFGDIRVLAVERIRSIIVSEAIFIRPADDEAKRQLEQAFTLFIEEPVTVRIRFSAEQARYIAERTWGAEQLLETEPDGRVVLTFTASGWWDIRRWILSCGAKAEVLAPPKLRAEVAAQLTKSAALYAPLEIARPSI